MKVSSSSDKQEQENSVMAGGQVMNDSSEMLGKVIMQIMAVTMTHHLEGDDPPLGT